MQNDVAQDRQLCAPQAPDVRHEARRNVLLRASDEVEIFRRGWDSLRAHEQRDVHVGPSSSSPPVRMKPSPPK
jgi:hypothetical protein